MGRLIYAANSSLDGYIEDPEGKFDWSMPDEEVHQYFNDLERSASTSLYGRRMYETMMVWETDPNLAADSPLMADFAEARQAAEKIVYSRTLKAASTRKTRIEREFNPQAIRQLKAAAEHDILIGGPNLAASAFRAGLVDVCDFFLYPIVVGGGKPTLPADVRLELELLEERRYAHGRVHLRYQVKQARSG